MIGWMLSRFGRTQSVRVEVGADIVSISDIAASVQQFGQRYLERVFTPQELAYCARAGGAWSMPSLAARFAAKEAVMKVLRPAKEEALPWSTIEVIKAPSGATEVALNGAAARLADKAGIDRFALSLSHDGGYATATAVALRPA